MRTFNIIVNVSADSVIPVQALASYVIDAVQHDAKGFDYNAVVVVEGGPLTEDDYAKDAAFIDEFDKVYLAGQNHNPLPEGMPTL